MRTADLHPLPWAAAPDTDWSMQFQHQTGEDTKKDAAARIRCFNTAGTLPPDQEPFWEHGTFPLQELRPK